MVREWREHTGRDLAPLRSLWAQAASAPGQSVFQRLELAEQWVQAFQAQVRLCIYYAPQSRVLAPFARRGDRLTLLGAGVFDYCDLIGVPGNAGLVETLADALLARDDWAELDIPGVREDSPWISFWQRLAPAGWRPHPPAPRLAAGLGPEGLDRLHPKIAKRWRRACQNGRFGPVRQPAARAALLDWMLRQKEARMRWLARANVLHEAEAAWLHRMVARHPALSELWSYEIEGEIAAGFLTWATAAVRYGYLLAFEPQFCRLSPAILMLYFVLRETQREGLEMDLLTGDQPFKMRFASGFRRLYRIQARHPNIAGHSVAGPMAHHGLESAFG